MSIDNGNARPSFRFSPGDWLNDTGLRSCSLTARGLWIDMNCIMHQGDPYGHLVLSQPSKKPARPILPAILARMVGSTEKEVVALLAELEAAGVFDRAVRDIIYSRQMVSQIAWAKGPVYEAWFNPGSKTVGKPKTASTESTSTQRSTSPSTSPEEKCWCAVDPLGICYGWCSVCEKAASKGVADTTSRKKTR